MSKCPITLPRFRTEREEAEWWDEHPVITSDVMKKPCRRGGRIVVSTTSDR
jgi:hypothetical protein